MDAPSIRTYCKIGDPRHKQIQANALATIMARHGREVSSTVRTPEDTNPRGTLLRQAMAALRCGHTEHGARSVAVAINRLRTGSDHARAIERVLALYSNGQSLLTSMFNKIKD